ncbi:Disease resistance protein (TIR-NBS-LRR class) family [Raphanus sativus]|uniref:Serine/threonine-protein phosphatase 1 regulatory subunit 10 n=1 Tax=Raphanus sativus TaxID=3726 RepID=A0A9W3CPS2_RAPSA|nr:disease resistance protein RPP2A-like [Raphanus sativus]KAJ4871515.1 Disease resistance protein (TIR-NBS-LRR class) family [Raphanus sativus]
MEIILEKCLTTSDLSNLDTRVFAANEDVAKYFRLATAVVVGGTEQILRVEDEEGKRWQFGFSDLNVSQRYVLTKGWSNYVKEKQLGVGDLVFFQSFYTDSSRLLLIGFRRSQAALGQCLDLTSLATSSEQLKEVEILPQLRSHGHRVTELNPVLVISCGENQDSEERYFISYISKELCLRGFTPLIYDLTRSTLTAGLEMLHSSRVGVIIFSKNYVCSRQCQDEFVAIMDHPKANNLVLLPVFFKVEVTDIRGQRGSFGRAFSRLEYSVLASQAPYLTSINKYQYKKGDEVLLAKNIVRDVCFLLNPDTNMNLRGRLQMKSILSLLNFSQFSAPHIVGLWGMAGIGKTTIAREIFGTQAERYEVCYFLPDFHIVCQTRGLSHLRDEFFSKICGEEKVIVDAYDTKLGFIRDRFLGKKLLIVLDGVSNARDAEFLVGGFGWLSGGHTLILTSRNRQVLVQCNAKEIRKIQKLSEPESLHLFSQFATEQNWKERTSLVTELVNYASGIPLALCALGSSLQNQCINEEKQHLKGLRQHPLVEIQDAFKISFSVLDDNEKNTFLDLACFFRGERKDHVVNILDGCGFITDLGIYGLIDESLISLVDNKIEMPNIFQDTGRFVVCQESNETGKRSRLCDPTDIVDVLTNNSGTEAIEGIFLDASGLTVELSPTAFEKMYRLRLLKLYSPTSKTHCNVCLPQGLYSLPDELRLLHWERYPLGSLPRNFNPKNIVELNMPYSNMTKLWKGTKNLEKLKRIILSHSRQLTKFPRLSKAKNLEHIDLEGCTSLVKVNSSILHHQKLTFLSLKDCSRLRSMPATVHLEALEVLNLSGCSELEDLQDFSPNLSELYLAGTAITKMPSSIGGLTRLVTLDLENRNRLQHLPPEISNLKAVVSLRSKRPASSIDLSSVEDTAPPHKRCRLKGVIESVILSLRKKKRESSVSRVNEETEKEKEVREKLVDGNNNDDFDPFAAFWDDRQKSILKIQEKLEDPDLSEEALVELLQKLEYVDITLEDLQGSNIGRVVNQKRRHRSPIVQRLAQQLINKWKRMVEKFLRLKPGDFQSPSLIGKRTDCNSESQNKHNPYPFPHPKDRETSVPEGSLNLKGLFPIRPGKPVCASYFHTGNCSSGSTCIFDHPSLMPVHKNTSLPLIQRFSSSMGDSSSDLVNPATSKRRIQKNTSSMASETEHLNQRGFSYSIGDSSSELVEASTKKPPIHKKTSSLVPQMPYFNPQGFSYSIGDSSSELVETSTMSEVTHTNVGRDTSDSWDDEEDTQFLNWLHL